jgi:predicted porin
MKKTLVAMAAIAATATSYAQVSLTGQVQYGYAKAATGATSYGGAKGDRNYIQFTANEDLGGGMTSGAMIQNRFTADSGRQSTSYVNSASGVNTDQLFEQVMVYVADSKLGELKFGRFSTQLVSAGGAGHFMEDYGVGTHSGTAYGRDSGQVQYTAPSFGGFQPWVVQKSGKSNSYFTGASANGFTSGIQTLGANASFAGFNYANGPIKTQFTTGSGFNKEKYNIINVQYTVGGVDIALNQMNQKNDQYTYNQATLTSYAHASTEIGLRTDVTPNLSMSISTLVNNKAVTTNADTKKAVSGIRAKYSLSKRSFVEGFYGTVAQDFGATTGTSATAGANGSGYYLGLAHGF